jgi:hypothetical protein
VDKFPKTQKEANPKVEDKTLKEFWPSLDAFQTVLVQRRETTTQNNESTKLMGRIAKGPGVIGVAPNGRSKVAMKARLLDSFARKETNTKRVRPWLH